MSNNVQRDRDKAILGEGPVVHTPVIERQVFCRDCQQPIKGRIKVGRCPECNDRHRDELNATIRHDLDLERMEYGE